jgi:hypothetical protein
MRWFLTLVIVCSVARPARADLASSLYGDVRDVIEELIQTEVTTSVVTAIETRSPALAFYMHGTLERLGSPYWGSLGRALKDDLTIAVSDFVYWHLSTGGGDGDVVNSARSFFGCVTARGDANASDGCKRLLVAVHQQHRPLIEVECRRAKPAPERRVACDIGLATLAALQGRGEVRHHLIDALGDIVLSEVVDPGLGDRLREVLTRWLDLPKDLPTPLLEALGNPDLGSQLTDAAIDTLCADPKMLDEVLRDPNTARGWICFAVSHSSLPAMLAAKIQITDNGQKLDTKVDFWRIQAALKDVDPDRVTDDSAIRLLAELAFDERCPPGNTFDVWPCKGARLAAGATLTIDWFGRTTSATVSGDGTMIAKPNRQLMLWLLRFRKTTRRIEELRALVPPSLSGYVFYPGSSSKAAKSVLRSMHRMARLVTELRARWYLWAQNSRTIEDLDVAELLHVAHDSLGAATGELKGSLDFLDKHAVGGAATLDIGDWLRLVMRADYRSLAMESLRAALDLRLASTNRTKETFFLTLAAYLLDTSNDGVGEAVARSAFRAAAKDLLLSASHRGVPRPGDRLRFRWLPRLSARMSFSDTYAVTDGNSKRNVVAADWPTMMVAINDYVGLEASVLDPIAPLAEMALRPAGAYSRYSYVLLDALRPRFGAWVAVPSLSRRIALTTGFGARFLDITRTDDGTKIVGRYGYKPSLTFDAGIQFVF